MIIFLAIGQALDKRESNSKWYWTNWYKKYVQMRKILLIMINKFMILFL